MRPKVSKINYRSLFDNTLDGLAYCQMIYDDKKRPIDYINLEVSKSFEELTGLKNVVGKKISEVIPGIKKSNPELFEIYGRVSLFGKTERFETYVKPLARWFLVSVYSSEKGYFTVVFQNTTEQKKLTKNLEDAKIAAFNVYTDLNVEKKKLDEAKAKEEALLASIADGIIALDKNGKIIFMNQTATTMLGYSSQESLGKQWSEILQAEDDRGNPILAKDNPIQAALLKTETSKITSSIYYLRKNKTRFPVSRTISPVILRGQVIGAINIFRDITKEKEIDRVKNEFVSLASHQLRTPLTGIAWTIELFIKKEKLTEKGKEYLNDIIFSVRRSSELVKLLLNTSRIENGSVGVYPKPLEIVDYIKKIMTETQMLCEKKKLSLTFTQHPEKLNIISDTNLLGYIVHNLLSNAIDYTQSNGKIELSLKERGAHLLLTIKDNGIGIPKNEQERIFEKFIRASNAVTAKPDGTGLGLYIVANGTKLLGGKVWFESEEKKGSTFFVELPLVSLAQIGEKGKELIESL